MRERDERSWEGGQGDDNRQGGWGHMRSRQTATTGVKESVGKKEGIKRKKWLFNEKEIELRGKCYKRKKADKKQRGRIRPTE